MRKKTVLRIIILALIIIWMITVFLLSNQSGNDSGGLSRSLISKFTSDEKLIDKLEPIVRKIAHLSEYAVRWNFVYEFIFDL